MPDKNPSPDSFGQRPIVLNASLALDCSYLPQDDVTVFIEVEPFVAALGRACASDQACDPERDILGRKTFDIQCPVQVAGGPPKITRVHAALAFGGKYYSVTMRNPGPSPGRESTWDRSAWTPLPDWKEMATQFGLKQLVFTDREGQIQKGWLECQSRVAEVMYEGIFGERRIPAAGLVLITGHTGSGKTTILNALLTKYLAHLLESGPGRRPHVIVIGDPIETVFYQNEESDQVFKSAEHQGQRTKNRPVDYTARIIGLDTECVDQALVDALRETPAAYVISELREEADFKAALRFAATGHLIFATAHNTSLIDALGNLMAVHKADNPSGRASLAQRLNAIAHLTRIEIDGMVAGQSKKLQVVLPTIWRGNHTGIRNFVCDGLASLLPRGVSEFEAPGGEEGPGVLGLAWNATKLARFADRNNGDDVMRFKALQRAAHQKDLQIR